VYISWKSLAYLTFLCTNLHKVATCDKLVIVRVIFKHDANDFRARRVVIVKHVRRQVYRRKSLWQTSDLGRGDLGKLEQNRTICMLSIRVFRRNENNYSLYFWIVIFDIGHVDYVAIVCRDNLKRLRQVSGTCFVYLVGWFFPRVCVCMTDWLRSFGRDKLKRWREVNVTSFVWLLGCCFSSWLLFAIYAECFVSCTTQWLAGLWLCVSWRWVTAWLLGYVTK
jgi:hypothetical protein